jgi:hypothetical protein
MQKNIVFRVAKEHRENISFNKPGETIGAYIFIPSSANFVNPTTTSWSVEKSTAISASIPVKSDQLSLIHSVFKKLSREQL